MYCNCCLHSSLCSSLVYRVVLLHCIRPQDLVTQQLCLIYWRRRLTPTSVLRSVMITISVFIQLHVVKLS